MYNNKIKSSRYGLRITIAITAVVSCLIGIVVGWSYNPFDDDDQSTSVTSNISQQVEESKQSLSNGQDIPEKNASGDQQQVSTPDTDAELPVVGVTITELSQHDSSVYAVATIENSELNGSCYFTFSTEDYWPVTRSASLDGTKCSVVIPESEFTKLGVWELVAAYIEGNAKAEARQYVTIN